MEFLIVMEGFMPFDVTIAAGNPEVGLWDTQLAIEGDMLPIHGNGACGGDIIGGGSDLGTSGMMGALGGGGGGIIVR
jgi:hypothetical protein